MKAISLFTGAGGMDISASNAGIETVFANDTEPEAAETQRMAMPETDFVVGDVKGVLWVPSIAVAVRRLHDTGRSGWWLLLAFRAAPGADPDHLLRPR